MVIRSDDGEVWREHKQACSDAEFLKHTNSIDLETAEELATRCIVRVITKDLPKYFALYSRTKEEFCFVGPLGGILKSQIVQHVSATFPEKALTKEIKVGIQACPIPAELCKRAVGNTAKASPIVTVEPRRRKFHMPIVLALPYPEGGSMKSFLSTSEESSLRLLCSISGGTDPAHWEDITGSTPLRFHDDHASFTTTVSAKFWLVNCLPSADSVAIAERIYEEAMLVPYMARFVVLAKSINTEETKLRVFCITDEKSEKTLENQEHFIEIARSRDMEVLKGSSIFVECSGNLTVMKQTQPHCTFIPFRDNRLHFSVKVRDMMQNPSGRLSFYRDEKGAKIYGARKPLCNLNVTLPNVIEEPESTETVDNEDTVSNISQAKEQYYLVDPDSDGFDLFASFRAIASEIGLQWMELARELDMSESTVWNIQKECGSDIGEKGYCLLSVWHEKNREKCDCEVMLRDVLLKMGRADLTRHLRSELSFLQSPQYKHDDSAFSDLAYDLGTPRGTPYHVSTPYPFKNESAEIINYNKEPVPLCPSEHDEDDDPNKPHFLYPEDAHHNGTNSAQYNNETNGIESFTDDMDYDDRLEQEVKRNLAKSQEMEGNGYVEDLNGTEVEIPEVMIAVSDDENLDIVRHVVAQDVSDVH